MTETAAAPVSTECLVKLHDSWRPYLLAEFTKPYMQALRRFLVDEKQKGKILYPKGSEYFNALAQTPFDQVKVVILGQDPYHGPGQAHGLCFSVRPDVPTPPSLKNIYQEIQADLGVTPPKTGCLLSWARQGVLLLNSVLTVVARQAASHQGKGWEQFTDCVVDALNQHRSHLVFLLWGSYAQRKGQFVDRNKHLVLTAPHPSPLSAHRGFLGCRHFSETNRYLMSHGIPPIQWACDYAIN